jgi:hypothetical protein
MTVWQSFLYALNTVLIVAGWWGASHVWCLLWARDLTRRGSAHQHLQRVPQAHFGCAVFACYSSTTLLWVY